MRGLSGVTAANTAGSEKRARLQAVRHARRSSNKTRRLHHHAVRTDDMEATRRFYEDVLGMPMVAALKDHLGRATDQETPFLHCFFEMGDGSCLAFFELAPGAHGPADKLPPDGLDHHIAMSMPDFADILPLKPNLHSLAHLHS